MTPRKTNAPRPTVRCVHLGTFPCAQCHGNAAAAKTWSQADRVAYYATMIDAPATARLALDAEEHGSAHDDVLRALQLVVAIADNPDQNPYAVVRLDPKADEQVRRALRDAGALPPGSYAIPTTAVDPFTLRFDAKQAVGVGAAALDNAVVEAIRHVQEYRSDTFTGHGVTTDEARGVVAQLLGSAMKRTDGVQLTILLRIVRDGRIP